MMRILCCSLKEEGRRGMSGKKRLSVFARLGPAGPPSPEEVNFLGPYTFSACLNDVNGTTCSKYAMILGSLRVCKGYDNGLFSYF